MQRTRQIHVLSRRSRRQGSSWARILVLGSLSISSLLLGPKSALAADPHILFFSKSSGYQHDVVREHDGEPSYAEKELRKLGERYGFRITATKDGSVFDGSLDDYDAFFFYTTGDLLQKGVDGGAPMTPAGKKRLLGAVFKKGKGFIGSHCATDTFHSEGDRFRRSERPDPYIELIGGEFVTHGVPQKARMRVVDPSFPGFQTLGEGFELHEEWYSLKNFHPEMHVLLVQETEGMAGEMYQRPPYPATWIHRHGAGRVFYTSMGHGREIWTDPTFARVLTSGILWVLRDSEADLSKNLMRMAPQANLPIYPPQQGR